MPLKFFRKKLNKKAKVVVSSSVRDYSNQQFFVGKAEEAKRALAEYGFPKELNLARR